MTAVLVVLPQPGAAEGGDLRIEEVSVEEPGSDGIGQMRLRVDLPGSCKKPGDVELFVREQAAELRVIVSGTSGVNGTTTSGKQHELTFDLEPHLPRGAELCFGGEAGSAVIAKFHKRKHCLSAWLPWRRGSAATA